MVYGRKEAKKGYEFVWIEGRENIPMVQNLVEERKREVLTKATI